MGGEGGFIVRATGTGTIVLACFGALDIWDLAAGETFILDTNHMVAYDESVSYKLRRAVEGRSIQSLKSGEGWVFEFTGPGPRLRPDALAAVAARWIESTLTATQQLADRRRRARRLCCVGSSTLGRHLRFRAPVRRRRRRARRP